MLEIMPIFDSNGKKKDTIFVGTYDGHLSAMRLEIIKEGLNEKFNL